MILMIGRKLKKMNNDNEDMVSGVKMAAAKMKRSK